ncbi:MAG TPA: TolC family protein [Thermoanaerobaculia bacterium]|jgi:outer membrane protein TolC
MNRRRLTSLAGILLGLCPLGGVAFAQAPAASPAPAAETLTLENALSMAFGSNRQLASEQLEVAKAGDRLAQTKSYRLPSLDVEFQGGGLLKPVEIRIPEGTLGTYPGVGPIPNTDTTVVSESTFTSLGAITVKQPLSDLYKISLSVKARETLIEAEKEQLRTDRYAVARDVRRAYYTIVAGEKGLDALRRSLAVAQETERVVAEKASEQTVLEPELLKARARVASAAHDLASLEHGVVDAREQLGVLLNHPLPPDFRVVDPPPAQRPAKELEAGAAQAGIQRPEVRKAQLQSTVAELDTKIAKTEFLPQVSAMVNLVKPWNVDFQPKSIFVAGIYVKWEVFDGGRRRKELAEKQKSWEQARLAAAEMEQRARIQAASDFRRVEEAESLLKSAELNRQASEEDLRIAKERFGAEALLLQNLISAQAGLAEANHAYTEALVSFWTARADYESSIGEEL